MNVNIYDDTDWGNDSTLYSNSHNTGYGGNYNFYSDNDYSKESLPINYMELPYRIDKIEEMLHNIYKKRKKHKKKHHKKRQKLKKRLKTVEMQNAYIVQYLASATVQTQNVDKYAWLKKSIENSTPHIVDLVSNVVTSKRQPLAKTLNQPLSLPDKSSLK